MGWLEAHSENYFGGGPARALLERVRRDYPLSLHGVGLSLGTTDELDADHLGEIVRLARELEPMLVSEHLCWGSAGGVFTNDLLPLPYTEEALRHMIGRVCQVQEALGRRLTELGPGLELVELSACMGIASWNGSESPTRLERRADDALRAAKRSGEGSIAVWGGATPET